MRFGTRVGIVLPKSINGLGPAFLCKQRSVLSDKPDCRSGPVDPDANRIALHRNALHSGQVSVRIGTVINVVRNVYRISGPFFQRLHNISGT